MPLYVPYLPRSAQRIYLTRTYSLTRVYLSSLYPSLLYPTPLHPRVYLPPFDIRILRYLPPVDIPVPSYLPPFDYPPCHFNVYPSYPYSKLFVGGLSWDTTDEGLRDYFAQYGKIDALTIMRDPATGTSRGFAFLTFEDAACADSVIGKEHTVDGKNIDPKRAIPRDEHLRNTRYFVGGLSHSTTPETMKAFFAGYGKARWIYSLSLGVVDATVMLDRESGRSKGFGFVTFEDAGPNLDSLVVGKGLILDDKEVRLLSLHT
ncbi:RNA-binding domain-containing protein [Coprinellus micaceus]|uniref:RNA-binding domain-containing protein n=1 Tax=Coprinellus micaceus TaxID=71717 RepID=A0A4Y7S7Q9_COPMI|nr:RNA-binding domain-containing protein [Coprinellus micaceus]